jgi:transcription elongation factor GreA
MSKYTYLTQTGYDKLKAELENYKINGRREVARAIAEAREKGDLSENAEYDAAKEAQGMLELRINSLEKAMATARVLDESELSADKVVVLANVKIKNTKTKKEITYKLVSEKEADLKLSKISVTSPMGKSLLGKAIGEVAHVVTPNGELEFEVLDIFFGD